MLRKIIKKILRQHKASSKDFVKYLRKKGVVVGEGVSIFDPQSVFIDSTRPCLLEIGNDVQITRGVTILTHGYDWSVLKGKYGEICGPAGKVKIGNNVFIGMQATILKGVTIGNNVIIGANSLVNKNVPDNTVVAGNPAKVIMTIDEYYEKRKKKQFFEAKELACEYYKKYNKIPPKEVFREFFWLFENRNREEFGDKSFYEIMHLVRNYDESVRKYNDTEPMFKNYYEFLKNCGLPVEKSNNY